MRKRVLVIDDKEDIRSSFRLALEGTEYQLDTAESGERGLEMILAQNYDIVYLDLKMPGMDGTETLRELRKINKDVPVYIITAFHNEFIDQLKGLQKEGIEFELLKKPIGSDQILTVTKGVLEEPTSY